MFWRLSYPIFSWISNKTLQYFTGSPSQKNTYITGNLTCSLTFLLDFQTYLKKSTGYPTKLDNTLLEILAITSLFFWISKTNFEMVTGYPKRFYNSFLFYWISKPISFSAVQLDIYTFGAILRNILFKTERRKIGKRGVKLPMENKVKTTELAYLPLQTFPVFLQVNWYLKHQIQPIQVKLKTLEMVNDAYGDWEHFSLFCDLWHLYFLDLK